MDPSILPVTIGIFGDWGGGKSSIMGMLKDDFETNAKHGGIDTRKYEKVVVLHFNGWLFEGYEDAKSALLASVLTSLRDHKEFGPKVAGKIGELLRQVDVMKGSRMLMGGVMAGGLAATVGVTGGAALIPLLLAGAIAGGKATAPDAAKAATDGAGPAPANEIVPDLRAFRSEFEKMLAASGIETLVILIDDLDRCSPERIIENLEAIKLFLNVPRTAFVIGADRRIIRHAVSWRYRDALTKISRDPDAAEGSENAERIVDDYLEKLIQIPYRLPKLSPAEIETYLTLLFCRRHLGAESESYALCASQCRALRKANRFRTFGLADVLETLKAKNPPEALKAALRIGANIAGQITDVLQGNPRQVKRFLNAYFLRRKLAEVAELTEIKDEILVKLMLLEYTSWPLFQKLLKSIDNGTGRAGILVDLESKEGKPDKTTKVELPAEWSSPHLARWLGIKPPLAEVDLKDYVWVTRDRLGTTLSNVTLIPPAVRVVLGQLLGGDLQQKAGMLAIAKLEASERMVLVRQLCIHAQRTPGEMPAYKALFECMKVDSGVIVPVIELFRSAPSADLPPALGVLCNLFIKVGGPAAAALESVLKAHRETDSMFGQSLKQRV